LSFDDMSGSYHDYSQEKAGEYPYVIANDHKEPQTPLNEIIDEVDEPFTPADLVDAHWKLHNEKFGHKPASTEAIAAAKELFNQAQQAKTDSVIRSESVQANNIESMSVERMNALLALDVYMNYIAYTNKLKGLRKQFYNDPSSVKEQYGAEAKDVLHDAQVKRDIMHLEYQDALQILFNARSTMPELSEFASITDLKSFTEKLEEAYGNPGRENVKNRNKIREGVAQQLGGRAVVDSMALDKPVRSS